jgi:hypothetical protein
LSAENLAASATAARRSASMRRQGPETAATWFEYRARRNLDILRKPDGKNGASWQLAPMRAITRRK